MGRFELDLLGAPRFSAAGRVIDLRTKKGFALLAFLAAEGGMHRREALADFLWPTSTRERARTALRTTLSRIRRALAGGGAGLSEGPVLVVGELLTLRSGFDVDVDLDVLRSAVAVLPALSTQAPRSGLVSALEAADAVYRGEFMEGFSLDDSPEFDLWLYGQRASWRGRISKVMSGLTDVHADTGQLAAALSTAEKWAARDPVEGDRRLQSLRGGLMEGGVRRQPDAAPAPGSAGPIRMPFVGRQDEFGVLARSYRAACSGRVCGVVITGEAGMGKTRLAEEFATWAAAKGAQTLWGRTFGTGTPLPYGLLVDALRPRIEGERAPDDLLEDRWLSELSRIFPELADRYPDLLPPHAEESSGRALLFEAVARMVGAMAGRSSRRPGATGIVESHEPLVMFLDDLQWTDAATMELLSFCCRSWARDQVRLLLVMTVRQEDLGTSEVGRWTASLERELPIEHVRLRSVGQRDVRDLVRFLAGVTSSDDQVSSSSDGLAEWLWGESEGHPLFLTRILDLLLERRVLIETVGPRNGQTIVLSGDTFDPAGLRGLLPTGLRELIRDKFRPLSARATDILGAAAVLAGLLSVDALLAVAHVKDANGVAALDELVSARLLEEVEQPRGGAHYAFTHEKIREVSYTEAGEARRQMYHHRALAWLKERGAAPAELARHALSAGETEEALDQLLSAAEAALDIYAALDAVSHYQRASELIRESPPHRTPGRDGVSTRLRLSAGLARAAGLIYDWARAGEAYEDLLTLAQTSGDQKAEWTALHGLSAVAMGYPVEIEEDEAVLHIESRREFEEPSQATSNSTTGGPRTLAPAAPDPRAASDYGARALLLAQELGDDDLVARSEFTLGVASTWSARHEGGFSRRVRDHRAPASPIAKSHAIQPLLDCSAAVGLSKAMIEGPDSAFGRGGLLDLRIAEEVKFWEELGTDYASAQLSGCARTSLFTGRYEAALECATKGLKAARSVGHSQWVAIGLRGLGDVLRELFQLDAAREQYSTLLESSASAAIVSQAYAQLCAVESLVGGWGKAHDYALEALRLDGSLFLPLSWLNRHHQIAALLRGGHRDKAQDALDTFDSRTRGQSGYLRLSYLRSAAVLTLEDGDTDRTLSLLHQARSEAKRLALLSETWQIAATFGQVYEQREEPELASRAYREAAGLIGDLAATITDAGLKDRYLTAPHISQVLERALSGSAPPTSSGECATGSGETQDWA